MESWKVVLENENGSRQIIEEPIKEPPTNRTNPLIISNENTKFEDEEEARLWFDIWKFHRAVNPEMMWALSLEFCDDFCGDMIHYHNNWELADQWHTDPEPIVSGYCSLKQSDLLHEYAGRAIGNIVEIGTWKGQSAIPLAEGSSEKVFCVDPFQTVNPPAMPAWSIDTEGHFHRNMKNTKITNAVAVRGLSEEIAPLCSEEIGLIFIDSEPTYAAGRRDFELWGSQLKDGGYILFDNKVRHGFKDWLRIQDDIYRAGHLELIDKTDHTIVWFTPNSEAVIKTLDNMSSQLFSDFKFVPPNPSRKPGELCKNNV